MNIQVLKSDVVSGTAIAVLPGISTEQGTDNTTRTIPQPGFVLVPELT